MWRSQAFEVPTSRADGPLITMWARARSSWLGDGLRFVEDPMVDILRVVNREGEAEDRVIVRVRLKVHREHPAPLWSSDPDWAEPRTVKLDERWTLGRRDKRWFLLSMDGDPLAAPVLSAPLIPTPAADEPRLREESLRELGTADRVTTVSPGELIDHDEPPMLALLDLSAVDGRFMPALLGADLARIVEAWEEASTGAQGPLLQVATPEASAGLLHASSGGAKVTLRIQDAVIRRWELLRLDASASPARVEVSLTVEAIRYLIDETTGGHVAGSTDVSHEISLTWTLELADGAVAQWRLVTTSDPAAALTTSR